MRESPGPVTLRALGHGDKTTVVPGDKQLEDSVEAHSPPARDHSTLHAGFLSASACQGQR